MGRECMWNKERLDYSLYLIADHGITAGDFFDRVEQALLGGVSVVQLRAKELSARALFALGERVIALTNAHSAPLIINDRLDITLALGAAGVHLGQTDLPAGRARDVMGKDYIIGVSVGTRAEAQVAAEQGADYVGVGAIFPTATKTDAKLTPLAELADIARSIRLPVVAIGGITAGNAGEVLGCGVSGLCVAAGIMCVESPRVAAAELRRISDNWREATR